jgi:hypothetical protein
MYGSQVIVPLNFLKFNLFSSGGDYYGTHVFHWYFTQGFPSMIWTFLPFAICGIVKSREWRLSGLIVWVLGVYSILGHKEFRYSFLIRVQCSCNNLSTSHYMHSMIKLDYIPQICPSSATFSIDVLRILLSYDGTMPGQKSAA